MKLTKAITAVAMFAAVGSTFAGEITVWPEDQIIKSTKTRAEVRAELEQAHANGSYVVGGVEAPELVPVLAGTTLAPVHGKTRAEVYQELVRAQAEGNYVVGGREYEDPAFQLRAATRVAGSNLQNAN